MSVTPDSGIALVGRLVVNDYHFETRANAVGSQQPASLCRKREALRDRLTA